MSWKHVNRRKRGEGKKGVKDFAETEVMTRATSILTNRWRMLSPFPLDPLDVYNAVFSPEQHRAIELLKRTMPSALHEGNEIRMTFDLDAYVVVQGRVPRPQMFSLMLPDSMPLPDFGASYRKSRHEMLVSQLPPELRNPLQEWARQWLTAARETSETQAALKKLFNTCNTIGHIKRLWPNACNLLPEKAQLVLRDAKVKSPYPVDAYATQVDSNGCTSRLPHIDPFWSRDNLAWFDDRLTEALCLPMVDDDEDFKASIEYTTS